jgi:uncharacterized membrane protein (DUF106 family)
MWPNNNNIVKRFTWLDEDKLKEVRAKNKQMVEDHKLFMAKLKAFSIIISIILFTTFGFYYIGYYNLTPLGHNDTFLIPTVGESIGHNWLGGFLSTLIALICGGMLIFVVGGLYVLYENLVDKYN